MGISFAGRNVAHGISLDSSKYPLDASQHISGVSDEYIRLAKYSDPEHLMNIFVDTGNFIVEKLDWPKKAAGEIAPKVPSTYRTNLGNQEINGALWKYKYSKLPKKIKTTVDLMEEAFVCTSEEELILYSGRNYIRSFKKGNIIRERGFLSTSIDPLIARDFTLGRKIGVIWNEPVAIQQGNPVVLTIKLKKGERMALGDTEGSGEIVLPRRSRLRVIACRKENGITYYDVVKL